MKPENCQQNHCGRCCAGGCEASTCALSLTEPEQAFLAALALYAFLPVAYAPRLDAPVCLELAGMEPETAAAALSSLRDKRLISVDYDLPLKNFDYRAYTDFERFGSIALTSLGQEALDETEVSCDLS